MARKNKKNEQDSKSITHDPRFSSVHSDPRFIRPKKKENKVVVDDRFKHLFDNEGSKQNRPRVDKYGRKISATHEQDQLKQFYHLDEDEEDDESESDEDKPQPQKKIIDYARGEALMSSSDEENEDESEDDEDDDDDDASQDEVVFGRKGKRRQKQPSYDSDDDFLDLNEDDVPTIETEAETGKNKRQSHKPMINPTTRLAVVNLDWDHVKAIDIFKALSSVISPSAPHASQLPTPSTSVTDDNSKIKKSIPRIAKGYVKRVAIYPSQFGKERMEKEAREGPPKDIFLPKKGKKEDHELLEGEDAKDASGDEVHDEEDDSDSMEDEDEKEEFNQRALRKYQLERLRYYYAIAEFDSASSAGHVFSEIDGAEFEATANFFDLSFVPEDMTFDDEPKDVSTSDTKEYKAVDFSTDALRHSKVKLTWDADDPDRARVTRKDITKMTKKEIEQMDYSNYIASSSEDEEKEDHESNEENSTDDNHDLKKTHIKDKRSKLRNLLGLGDDGGSDEDGDDDNDSDDNSLVAGDMQITFTPALSVQPSSTDQKKRDEETSLDTYKRKERERLQKKKERKRQTRLDQNEEGSEEQSDEEAGDVDDFFDSDNKIRDKDKEIEKERAELALLVDSDSGDNFAESGNRHFDMKEILRAEKQQSKSAKKKYRQKNKKGDKDGDDEKNASENFEINVDDSRFNRLFEDHEFAIDPSNPHFKKTKAMSKLLDASRSKRTKRLETESKLDTSANNKISDVSDVIERLKRKSSSMNSNGHKSKKIKKVGNKIEN